MGDYTELKRLAEEATAGPWVSGGSWVSTAKGNSVADCPRGDESFIAAANPTAVLALIAENERLTGCIVQRRAQAEQYDQALIKMAAERDQLKAENEQLAKTADCWDRLNIQNKALSDSFRTERDQLRAEVAGLKTGYEAYERVNAELKAECEWLRKHQPSAEVIWCACGDGYAANSYGAGFMAANNGVCENCDAAMGKGERS